MVGHEAQQQLHAAEPKQHAMFESKVPTQQPIVDLFVDLFDSSVGLFLVELEN